MIQQFKLSVLCAALSVVMVCSAQNKKTGSSVTEKTAFQTSGPWKPVTDVRSDVAIVYGSNDYDHLTFEQRVQSWRDRGYITHFMTGIAWGEYKDYFTGKWDGVSHLDEGQVTVKGDTIWHGHLVPYIVPTENYLKYMKEVHVKRVIDAGIDAIYMEEPEFWSRSGYSDAFKREWKKFYGFDWRPQDASPENTYLSNKLKYHLYYNALNEVFTYAKAYGKTKGMNVRCYVPTHSLVNYSQWQIVSPEASLASLSCVDGYIAQVWTGTSREPNFYNGKRKERVFETAFLEYGSMESMTEPTGRKMFFLTDPIEDWPRDWADYKKNYQATFTAELLYPQIANYEVMPWPDRIYEGLYLNPTTKVKEHIPRTYSTQMQVMINSLNAMPASKNKVTGSQGISILMSNSLMFQRFPTHAGYEDPQLSNFYGLALPFVKRGVPVRTVHLENLGYAETLKQTKILMMTYSNMKPQEEASNVQLAEWVKGGGILVFCGRDTDPFQTVQEWWNTKGNDYKTPSDHLFKLMGMSSTAEGEYSYGKGTVYVIRKDPKEFVLAPASENYLVKIIQKLYDTKANTGKLSFKNNYYLARGAYDLVSVMDESVSEDAFVMKGTLIDLFDPQLPVVHQVKIQPGNQGFFLNIDRVTNKKRPQVLAAASRVYDESVSASSYSFVTKSPANTTDVMRVLTPKEPKKCSIIDIHGATVLGATWKWDASSKTCLLSFENNPEGVCVLMNF